ncbi:hypothetical protein FPQ18DRAFT_15915 [Pyronema domesticum]|uniref:Similar to Uncharacterized protein C56F8.02 acc. no. Q10250 n=1 Tax=Pyronema omphalodes (strain CBS 100304) TaxID=1076935 RepID=U4LF96_PYROM|nr:hypothetical protein FPQ18DRAFT_15915 [Pyronema domesticum]CCX13621.1 Similar to Uncharacterized protein C56F8.02; acc. no. Q10250 [Pyronema omphalodes CBS 100304]
MDNPTLIAQLSALDAELEEGDITQKGYQKRRTLLLSQYGLGSDSESGSARSSIPSAGASGPPGPPGSSEPLVSPLAPSQASAPLASPSYPQFPHYANDGGSYQAEMAPGMSATLGSYGSQDSPASPQSGDTSSGSFLQSAVPPHMRSNSKGRNQRNSFHGIEEPMASPQHTSNFSGASSSILSAPSAHSAPPVHSAPPPPGSAPGFNFTQHYTPEFHHYDMPAPGSTSQQALRSNTMNDQIPLFSDFTAQAYENEPATRGSLQIHRPESDYIPHSQQPQMARYSTAADGLGFSPTAAVAQTMLNTSDLPQPAVTNTLMPLEPREVPFAVYDPHNTNIAMSRFENIHTVLRHRARTIPKQQAYVVLDNKGKEQQVCSWEKLSLRAEKVAQVIREKSGLYRGDRIALVYRDAELIDFAVALLGCFIAGVVAVPINDLED